MKVYVVTAGWYSDLEVYGVYSDKSTAEQVSDIVNGGPGKDIPELEVDSIPDHLHQDKFVFCVIFDADGNAKHCNRAALLHSGLMEMEVNEMCGVYHVWARDREHAIKSASDWRARRLVESAHK
ncbi:MAG: hypothetical protein NVS9B4_01210 [Candidatus Acidiferrum sp.]